jgi:hypothetical protein
MKKDRLTIWVLVLFQGMVIGYAVCVQTEPSQDAVSSDPCHISVVEYSVPREIEYDAHLIAAATEAASAYKAPEPIDDVAYEPMIITVESKDTSRTVGTMLHDGQYLELSDPNWLTDESVRLLCTSGRVCAVMGHQWHAYPDVTMQMVSPDPYRQTHDISTLEIVAYIRQCVLCGRRESRNMTEWKKE